MPTYIKVYGDTRTLRRARQTVDMLGFLGQFKTRYELELNNPNERPQLIIDGTILSYEQFSEERASVRKMIKGLERKVRN